MSSAWNYFRTTPLGELVTGTAHQSHPTDTTAPLHERFAGQTILAVHIALERAATVRVTFSPAGEVRLTGIRNIKQRNTTEFTEVLRAEVAATGAHWAVLVMATGWQAVLGQRAARPELSETASAFARHKLMFETPEVVVPRAQVDRVYTAIDHPTLDKSVVFSLRRRELEQIGADIRKCGIGIAAVRIPVAAQLEVWLHREGESGLRHDLLLTDGLSALLLNTEQRDFVSPQGAVESEQPRQSVQRPSAIEEDIARFITAHAGRSVTFLGPEELCVAVKKGAEQAEIIRPPQHEAHDAQIVALLSPVRHDLNFEAREVRPALPRSWRRVVIGYLTVVVCLIVLAASNAFYAGRVGYSTYRLEKEAAQRSSESQADQAAFGRMTADLTEANTVRSWAAANYHAQRFCYALLKDVPSNAALDKLAIEFKDGQIALTFIVLGDPETQLSSHRAVERAITELKYKIGGEDAPTTVANGARGIQYRMHIIVPDAGEVGT
jgi:hypothetical protein